MFKEDWFDMYFLPSHDKKIDYHIPTFTLDVNQIALKPPTSWPKEMNGLFELEYNYFARESIELCVTPETDMEIVSGESIANLGNVAYNRFMKSKLFKKRPQGTVLTLTGDQPNTLWTNIRYVLYRDVCDSNLEKNHISDITQMFYHCTASGWLKNSAFLTMDKNFHRHGDELYDKFGLRVMYPSQAWEEFKEPYKLYQPTNVELSSLYSEQQKYFRSLMHATD